MTMQVLADGAGLSIGFISQVERGLAIPSISSLRALARVLDKPVSYFLEQFQGGGSSVVQLSSDRHPVVDAEIRYVPVDASFSDCALWSSVVIVPAGYRSDRLSHEGEEMFFILAGELTAEVEQEELRVLEAGDAIHLDATREHAIWNNTAESCKVLWSATGISGVGEVAIADAVSHVVSSDVSS